MKQNKILTTKMTVDDDCLLKMSLPQLCHEKMFYKPLLCLFSVSYDYEVESRVNGHSKLKESSYCFQVLKGRGPVVQTNCCQLDGCM